MTSEDSMIPKRVRQRRMMLGITQKTVATLLEIDCSTLYRWEHTTKIPDRTLAKLAKLYRCTVDEFRMHASAPWAIPASDDQIINHNGVCKNELGQTD